MEHAVEEYNLTGRGDMITGLVRWALYFRGEPYRLETARKDKYGKNIVVDAYRGKTHLYEEFCAGSVHPHLIYEKEKVGALRLEIHMMQREGGTEVVLVDEDPTNLEIKWLAFSPFSPEKDVDRVLPTYIYGLRVISPVNGTKDFIVMEGI